LFIKIFGGEGGAGICQPIPLEQGPKKRCIEGGRGLRGGERPNDELLKINLNIYFSNK